jgi:hypothetical protein
VKRFGLLLFVTIAAHAGRVSRGAESAALAYAAVGDSLRVLWQIGRPDGKNTEFALAPGGYTQFRDDGFFVVGQSTPAKDWPYVRPAPTDPRAELRPHASTVLFGVATAATAGTCRLTLDLVDTHSSYCTASTRGAARRPGARRRPRRLRPGRGSAGSPGSGASFQLAFTGRFASWKLTPRYDTNGRSPKNTKHPQGRPS